MRRDERKRTGARGVSNYRQETTMPRQPSKTSNDDPTEGWQLVERDSPSALKSHHYCTVCGGGADWLWEYHDRRGECLEVIPVCEKHAKCFVRNPDDPNQLTRTGSSAPRGMVITRDELADYLHHCHFIPMSRGRRSASHWKFERFKHTELMKQLQSVRALQRSSHFSGWEPREGFIQATLLRNGTWEAVIQVGKSGKTKVVRSVVQPSVQTSCA
jgi:hypothetical protein